MLAITQLRRAVLVGACVGGGVWVPQVGGVDAQTGAALAQLPPEHPHTQPPGGGLPLDLQLLTEDRRSTCSTVFLTTVLGSRHDPMRGGYTKPDFAYFERYYRSILTIPGGRARAVILHDMLPENITSGFTTGDGAVSFVKVNLSSIDRLLGLNDLRYLLFEEQVRQHPEWETVFATDGQDVVVLHNPCTLVEKQPEKVFSHAQEQHTLKSYTWMKKKFDQLGGKYMEWFETAKQNHSMTVLNAGILGGKRAVVLKALAKLNEVIMDPELPRRKANTQITANMAAFNYVLRTEFGSDIVYGFPLHSKWFGFENRTDVYFWHK